MDEPRWHVLQLRHPEPNIGPFRVIVVGLLDDVEAPSFARVVPDAGGIVPVTCEWVRELMSKSVSERMNE